MKVKLMPLFLAVLYLLGATTASYAATPTANAGPDQVAFEGDFIQLDGTQSTGDGIQFSWTQVQGPPVTLNGANTATPSFTFPAGIVTVVLELTVTDSAGVTDKDRVKITREMALAPKSLSLVAVPEPKNLGDYVQNKEAAIALGKALFWDMQVGGDGVQACASCHFKAGTDGRTKNTLNSGLNGAFDVGGPNYTLKPEDFPFFKLADPLDRHSTVLANIDDIVGAQGVVKKRFDNINPNSATDFGSHVPDSFFNVNGLNTRQVTGRNAPTVINAIFNTRNFWDGRANFVFNGVNPFGQRDPNARIYEVQGTGVVPVVARLEKASLASQAVGPPNNNVEMSWDGRTFRQLGRKLLNRKPLAQQEVHPNDSVLGGMIDPSGKGLNTTYQEMIKAAFWPKYWNSNELIDGEYSVMEANFSLFFGLSIQLYEATLVSDDTPYDRFQLGDANALTEQQKRGLEVFLGPGKCIACHKGPEFTGASIRHTLGNSHPSENEIIERMVMGDNGVAAYDNGFYNIGVSPIANDLGVGGQDPFGNPLSFTRLVQQGIDVGPPFKFPDFVGPFERVAVDGAFKTPTLRNVELTGPYMHNGSMATLEQVVQFYARGANFRDQNIDHLDPDIEPLGLSEQDMADLVAFMKALTDDRVRFQQAPFDHPQLFIANGHVGDDTTATNDGTGAAASELIEFPAVGAEGGPELKPFTPAAAPPSNPILYLSLLNDPAGAVGALTGVKNEDILSFDGSTFSLIFDGSDLGLDGLNLNAFYIVDSDTILMSFDEPATIGSLGTVDDSDIVQFDATSLGETTAGTFSLYFDGSDVELSRASEDIDAIDLLPDGRLLISTVGVARVGALRAEDEDLLAFTPSSLGSDTSGTWAIYFDGSLVRLSVADDREDVNGTTVADNGDIYLTTVGKFAVTGVSGGGEDVFVCAAPTTGSSTTCTFKSALFFDGSVWGLSGNSLDGIDLKLP